MERPSNPQLELFSQSNDARDFKVNSANPFLERIWNYEKTVLIVIAVLVTGIIAFSLGVEKGKRSVTPPVPSQAIVRKEEAVKQISAFTVQQPGSFTPLEKAAVRERSSLTGFTIQVASFKSKASAQREAENLKKRGLSAILLNKGGYVVLCAGTFPDKKAAQPLIAELNKRYRDCQIRRL